MELIKLSENFYQHEFQCKGSGKLNLHPGFLAELQIVRTEVFRRTNMGMIITSGCRSFEYNKLIGGHERSLHICDKVIHKGQQGTLGVDVATVDPVFRGWLFHYAWGRGFSIGWNKLQKFCHLDMRIWVGLAQTSFDY